MEGLELYNKFRAVPTEAKKLIQAGRLKGMSDINPMWRLKMLTEQFGPCGLGWYYEITEQRIEEGSNEQKVAFTNISLYVKYDGEWSKAIQGTGGSSFIAKERAGLYTSDECFKMSLTDAISVACKSLGIGADVYFEKDRTKYNATDSEDKPSNDKSINNNLSEAQVKRLFAIGFSAGYKTEDVKKHLLAKYKTAVAEKLTKAQYNEMCKGYENLKTK